MTTQTTSAVPSTEASTDTRAFPGTVFLSYSSSDREAAVATRDLLKALGHDVWMDEDSIEYGTWHWETIRRELEARDTFLLLASEPALGSQNVFDEYFFAMGVDEAHKWLGHEVVAKFEERCGPLPKRKLNLRVVKLGKIEDFGKFAKVDWSQLPQAPRGGEIEDTASKAAWAAAAAASPQKDQYDAACELAQQRLASALHTAEHREPSQPLDDVVRGQVLPELARTWLADARIISGLGELDLAGLGAFEAWTSDSPWSSWDNVRTALSSLADSPDPLTLQSLQPFRDTGTQLDQMVARALPPPEELLGRDPSRYDLRMSRKGTENTAPQALRNWLTFAWWGEEGVGFTFLVGPEAVHTGPESLELDSDAVVQGAVDLGELDGLEAEDIRTFLGALTRANRGKRKVKQPEPARRHTPSPGETEVLTLRALLLLLAHGANQAFVTRHQALGTPVSIDGWMTPVSLDDSKAAQLAQHVDAAISALDTWAMETGATNTWDRALGSTALKRALERLHVELLPEEADEAADARERPHAVLTPDTVQWLADVFWHSMVFSLPVYPTASELAIQATLMHDSNWQDTYGTPKPPGRTGYGQIWASRHVETLAEAISDALDIPWKSNPTCRAFYKEMAATLRRQFDYRRENPDYPGPEETTVETPIPLAVSTAFDLELETALATTGDGSYHVAFPVVAVADGHADEDSGGWGSWRWAVGTFNGPGARGVKDPQHSVRTPVKWDLFSNLQSADELSGPLVLKINGAPLIHLPETHSDGKSARTRAGGSLRDEAKEKRTGKSSSDRYLMPVAMGDYDNMQFLMIDLMTNTHPKKDGGSLLTHAETVPPPWLSKELAHGVRYWLGVGISEQDWGARMQLFIYATRAYTSGSIGALFPSPGAGRDAFLRSCGIRPVTGSLEQLRRVLSEKNASNGGRR